MGDCLETRVNCEVFSTFLPEKMPRGGKRGHKGGHRRFTDPQAIEQQRLKEEKEKEWRRQRGEESSEDEDEKESGSDSDSDGDDGGVAFSKKKEPESSSEEESSSEDEERKPKGAEGMMKIANPNRVQPKQKKVTAISHEDGKPQLSRREREEMEKQRAKAHYQKLHAQGKTEEARADLARLAIIKKQREEAAKKREEAKRSDPWKTGMTNSRMTNEFFVPFSFFSKEFI